jgi:hypothetical protein
MKFHTIFFSATILAIAPLAISPAIAQERASSPLSQSFTRSPLVGGPTQAPSLWYYGPSYSLYYDRPPAGAAGTGPVYQPSPFADPYYGYDFLERSERGHRFGR